MKSKVPLIVVAAASLAAVISWSLLLDGDPKTAQSSAPLPSPARSADGHVESSPASPVPMSQNLPPTPSREPGALTDPLSSTPLWHPGVPATAIVDVGGRKTPVLRLNQAGEFSRVYIAPKQTVNVSVAFPTAEVGSKIVASLEDGGELAEGRPVNVMTVNAEKTVSFAFTAGAAAGRYRVVLRHAGESKVVVLWAALAPKTAAN